MSLLPKLNLQGRCHFQYKWE